MGKRKNSIFDDLCNALTKELQIYKDLLEAMKMKQNAIKMKCKKGDVQER